MSLPGFGKFKVQHRPERDLELPDGVRRDGSILNEVADAASNAVVTGQARVKKPTGKAGGDRAKATERAS